MRHVQLATFSRKLCIYLFSYYVEIEGNTLPRQGLHFARKPKKSVQRVSAQQRELK